MPVTLDLTAANILDKAKKYSMYPIDAAEGYVPKNETHLAGDFTDFRHTLIGNDQKITRLSVVKPQPGRSRGADFEVKPSLTAVAGAHSYFLPWDGRGAAVEMTIPRFRVGDAINTNPDIFFTAALSGCSIIFKGTADKPTIFHCGTEGVGGGGAATVGDSNKFFRKMLRDIKAQNLGRSNYNVGSQVRSTDYMVTKAGGGTAVGHETNFKDMVSRHYENELVIESVNIWGVVFGFRTNTSWSFYLQENATITYYKVEDIMKHFIEQAALSKQSQFDLANLTEKQLLAANLPRKLCARPAVVTQVFPQGGAHAFVKNSWRTLKG